MRGRSQKPGRGETTKQPLNRAASLVIRDALMAQGRDGVQVGGVISSWSLTGLQSRLNYHDFLFESDHILMTRRSFQS